MADKAARRIAAAHASGLTSAAASPMVTVVFVIFLVLLGRSYGALHAAGAGYTAAGFGARPIALIGTGLVNEIRKRHGYAVAFRVEGWHHEAMRLKK